MKAIVCSHCDALGTPHTMFWCGVDQLDYNTVLHGPLCRSCVGDPGPFGMPATVEEADQADAPTDHDLDDWIGEHGIASPEFVSACEVAMQDVLDEGGDVTEVPYGSTTVVIPEGAEVPEKVLRAVAFEWYEACKLDWSSELGPVLHDGSRQFWLVTVNNDDEKG